MSTHECKIFAETRFPRTYARTATMIFLCAFVCERRPAKHWTYQHKQAKINAQERWHGATPALSEAQLCTEVAHRGDKLAPHGGTVRELYTQNQTLSVILQTFGVWTRFQTFLFLLIYLFSPPVAEQVQVQALLWQSKAHARSHGDDDGYGENPNCTRRQCRVHFYPRCRASTHSSPAASRAPLPRSPSPLA